MTSRQARADRAAALRHPAPGSWFGLRTLGSKRFRIVAAVTVLLISVTLLAFRMTGLAITDGQYGVDFQYWYMAAVDVSRGVSPYPQAYLTTHVPAVDFGYKYPPTFAQLIVPLTALSLPAATAVWAAIQTTLGFLAIWLAGLLGGARRTFEHFLWSCVAAALYLPYFNTVYYGNVSAIQAFQVTLLLAGGVVAGGSLASAILLKTTPLALVPAALSRGGRLRAVLVVSGVLLGSLSLLASPQAWLDFVRIQPNLFAGANLHPHGSHPASVVAFAFPELPTLAEITRVLTLVLAALLIFASVMAARRPRGWSAAMVLGITAALIIPGALWYHYLAVLLPPAAFAWPRATTRQRVALVTSAATVSLASVWLPLGTIGAGLLIVSVLRVHARGGGQWLPSALLQSNRGLGQQA